MSEILRVAYKEILRRRRDPFALLIWILIPLSLAAIFALIFGLERPGASLLVVDNDDSFVSNLLVSSLGNNQLEGLIDPEPVDEAVGIDRIMEGKVSALLIIPDGFGAAYLEGGETKLKLMKNPMEGIQSSICQSILETLLEMGFIARSLFDSPISFLAGMAEAGIEPTQMQLDATSLSIGHTFQKIQQFVYPPLVSLEVESIEKEEEVEFNFAAAYYPGLILMALLFISVGLSQDVWREKRHGALARCITTPMSLFNFFVGKLLGAMILAAIVLGIMLIAGPLLFDLTYYHLWAIILLGLVASGLLLSVFSVFVLAISRNERTSNVITDILLMALMLTSGTTVPIEVLPASLVKVASFTPVGHVLLIYKELLQGTLPLAKVLGTAGAYVAVAVIFAMIAGRGLFPRFTNR